MSGEDPTRAPGPDRLRLRLGVGKTGDPETVNSPPVDPPEGPKGPRRRASTFVAVSPKEGEKTPDPSGGKKRKTRKSKKRARKTRKYSRRR